MAEPSTKSDDIEQQLQTTFGFDRRSSIQRNMCIPPPIGCGKIAIDFRDDISKREFSISGLCQECQNKLWYDEPA